MKRGTYRAWPLNISTTRSLNLKHVAEFAGSRLIPRDKRLQPAPVQFGTCCAFYDACSAVRRRGNPPHASESTGSSRAAPRRGGLQGEVAVIGSGVIPAAEKTKNLNQLHSGWVRRLSSQQACAHGRTTAASLRDAGEAQRPMLRCC